MNEPSLNFADADVRYPMLEALSAVRSRLGHEYDLVIGGKRLRTEAKIVSINPARPAEMVGIHQRADERHVEAAIEAAQAAFATWSRVSASDRAALLVRTAGLVRQRKFELCAWLIYEVGKNWAEADADVGETIDFLEFYAREALRLAAATTPIQLPRRTQPTPLHSPRRRRRHSAVELPLRDHGGHDLGGHRLPATP